MKGSATNSFAAGAIEAIVSCKVAEIENVSFPSRATLSVGMENCTANGPVKSRPIISVKL